jgi:DNA polymerase-3 subunit alpha
MKIKKISKLENFEIQFDDVKKWYNTHLKPGVIDEEDQNVFNHVFENKRFAGTFQFTNPATQKFIHEFHPKNVMDLATATAIYRPGPLAANVDKLFVDSRKTGKYKLYNHVDIDKTLEPTMGYVVFQEQLMALAHNLSHMSLIDCDRLRKAILKRSVTGEGKNKSEAQILEEVFIDGAVENGYPRDKAKALFEDVAAFSSYAFNKTLSMNTTTYVYNNDKVNGELKSFKDIQKGDIIKSRDEASGNDIFLPVVEKHDHGVLEIFKFTLDDGRTFECSKEHKFRTTCGKMLPIWKIMKEEIALAKEAVVISCESAGKQQTYDLEVDHPDHQFYLADGTLTSNSHSVSYAFSSYQTSWLMTYFEPQWLCAYIESQIGDPDKRAAAISAAKSYGYKVSKIDINSSSYDWSVSDDGKSFFPSFRTAKGIGDAAIEEILAKRPYTSIESAFWDADGNWRHSKFNKRVWDALIKLEAFDSMDLVGPGKTFASYKQMHKIVIEGHDELKKKKGKGQAYLKLAIEETDPAEWTTLERVKNYADLVGGLNIDMIMTQDVQDHLMKRGIVSIDELPEGKKDVVWFVPVSSELAVTKNGKKYVKIMAVGSSGKQQKIFAWNISTPDSIKIFQPYAGETERGGFGLSLKKMMEIT